MSDEAGAKFTDSIPSGFDAVQAKTENGLQVFKDFVEVFRNRAKIEIQYARELGAFYKVTPGTGMFTKQPPITKETKSLREALTGILETGIKVAEQHRVFAAAVNDDLVKGLDGWLKTKGPERQKIVDEGKKVLAALAAARQTVARAKEAYERLNKDADAGQDALLKAQKDEEAAPAKKGLPEATKRAEARVKELQDKAAKGETAYKDALAKANDEISSCKDKKLPAVLDQLQAWDTDRYNTLLAAVKQYKTLSEALPPALTKAGDELAELADAANVDADLKEFIESTKANEKDLFTPVEFQKFQGKYSSSSSSDATSVADAESS